MGIEIERKFLVKSDGWRKLGCAVRYAQGYLCSDRNRTVRVRTVGDKGFLTVKGRGSGIAHPEYEYEIPYNEARTMLDELAEKPVIAKTRTKIPFAGFVWEVDEFFGDNEGGRTAPMTKVTFGEDGTLRNFLTEWQKVIATGGYKPYEDDINEEFSLELFGMAIMSTARIGKIKSLVGDKFEWNVAALPKVNADDKGGIAVGGSCVVMFAPDNDPAQVDATWEFVQFMVSAEEQFQFHQATGYIPVNKTVYNLPEADKWFEENPMYKVAIDCIHASNPNVQEPFDIINWEIDSVIKTHMLAFANGEETLDECHDRIVEECNERLDDYHLAND